MEHWSSPCIFKVVDGFTGPTVTLIRSISWQYINQTCYHADVMSRVVTPRDNRWSLLQYISIWLQWFLACLDDVNGHTDIITNIHHNAKEILVLCPHTKKTVSLILFKNIFLQCNCCITKCVFRICAYYTTCVDLFYLFINIPGHGRC